MSEDEFEEVLVKPPDFCEAAENSLYLLPAKSRSHYERCYRTYTDWKTSSHTTSSSEIVLMAYFHSLAKNYQPSTLWSYYSMLKTTILINEKLDISTYHKLSAFIKKQSHGFQSKKSKVFSSEEVEKFLTEAPDDKYLFTKVVLIFGIAGACRKDDLTNIKLQDLKTHGDLLLVKIPDHKPSKPQSFTIGNQLYAIVKKYQDLRPPNTTTDRFFLNFRNGKCTVQAVGKNRFGTVPKEIATYLNLPNADQYTGHCFRRTSATVLAGSGDNITTLKCFDGWKSSTGDIEELLRNKSKRRTEVSSAIHLRTSTSSDSDHNSQDPLAKKIKVEDDAEDNDATSLEIENVGNERIFHVQNCANVSPDQGYGDTPGYEMIMIPEWMHGRSDHIDASPNGVVKEEYPTYNGTPSGITAVMPVTQTAEQYNMSHPNRGKCLIFNHEVFETGFSKREGSTVDAKRIKATFTNLGFEVVVHDNLEHSDVMDEIKKLSGADHTNNDCVCVFVLTYGLNNDFLMAKDAAYQSDKIWKPFTADNCPTLAGKPKLFFYQACRGDKLDGGITWMARSGNTQTDSAIASCKIPTHSDFLIAHSSVDGFFPWRNPEEGTSYVQCLCSVLDQFAATTDLLKMLTITARRIATEYQSYDDMNVQKNEQKQVPSTISMLIRDLYFTPK